MHVQTPDDGIFCIRTYLRVDTMKRKPHPDSHELDDWPLHGPKNPEIANLVERLAYDHGLRLHEIEDLILQALAKRLSEEGRSEG